MFSVVPLTLAISLCLVFTFVVFFLREQSRRRFGSSESDALLPLSEETPTVAASSGSARRVVLDLGGRLPKQRRRPCGRHGRHGGGDGADGDGGDGNGSGDGSGGGNCDDCGRQHQPCALSAAGNHLPAGADHLYAAAAERARRQEPRETDAP